MSPPLVERDAILQRLEALLRDAAAGAGRLVCLAGEAGAGKSALASALGAMARDRMRVMWGACEDLTTPQPLGPLHDLARQGGWADALEDSMAPLSVFSTVLSHVASEPTLVVLEDLHWADDATLDLVRFLGRRIRTVAALIVVTARDDTAEAQARLRRALVDIPAEAVTRFDVPRLSEPAVEDLARNYGRSAAGVFALTGGNAFLVSEVLRTGRDCPATVRDALLVRAERLSKGARRVLDAASVFPRRVEDWLLRAACAPAGDADLEECVAEGMLVGGEGFYAFRHEIARQAIEGALSAVARRRLNERALAALKSRYPGATARLVHHAVAAQDSASIQEFAPVAGAEASRAGAHGQALQHYAAALAHAHGLPILRRADLNKRYAIELQLVGRPAEALEIGKAALELRWAGGDELGAGDQLRALSRVHYNLGDSDSAHACAAQSVEVLEKLGPGPELAMAYADLALNRSLADDNAAASKWAEKSIELASELKRNDIVAEALSPLGVAKQWVDHAAAKAHFERALELALQSGKHGLIGLTYVNAACIEFNARENESARRLLDAGSAYCRERDIDTVGRYIAGWSAELLVREGRWAEAEATAHEVVDIPFKALVLRFPANAALARLRIRKGEGDLEKLLEELAFTKEPQRLLVYAPIFGERAWVTDVDRPAALDMLAEAAPVAAAIGNIWAAGEIAYWRGKLGEHVDPLPDELARPYQLQFAGDWRAAAEAWSKIPAPYEQALALLEGDEAGVGRGLLMLDALGARATADRARRELRQRGARSILRGPRPSTRANAAGLTRRQMDVLELLDGGLSNAEIAQKLFVSVKTVDNHVSALLTKLRAKTRGEATARARRAGLIKSNDR